MRVVNHLTEQEDPFTWVLLKRSIRDLDRVLHAVAESKEPRDVKHDRAKIHDGAVQLLLTGVLRGATLLNLTDQIGTVGAWNVKLLGHTGATISRLP